jgi:protein-L-isoaspartate(D-aspartate) O-methyltransferase
MKMRTYAGAARVFRLTAAFAFAILATLVVAAACTSAAGPAEDTASQRQHMVADIARMATATARETGRPQFADRVMEAMQRVERHQFVPQSLQPVAYRNEPLPIGEGQTISQPYIVALSTELIDPQPEHVVLEIGTGSGYQAAVLAALVQQVYSIEIVEPLGRRAAARLSELGYRNVEVRIGDGYVGWPEKAPFDAIVVTAAAPNIPEPLVDQLKPGGKMVIPVNTPHGGQHLLLVHKKADGTIAKTIVLPVRFVPMTGEDAARPRK